MSLLKELVRRTSIRLFAQALAIRSQPYAAPAGPLVVIAPHPDDETLGCGALIAFHLRRGDAVHVVFLTDGEGSHDGHPSLGRDELRTQRCAEARAALSVLGTAESAANVSFLNAPDGGLDRLDAPAQRVLVSALAEKIRAVAPVAVLTPYALGGSTEHTAAFHLTARACAHAGGGVLLEYPIWAWWNAWRLRPQLRAGADNLRLPLHDWRELKCRALACHRTQTEPTPPWPEAVLPQVIARACCGGAHEFFFRRRIVPAASGDFPLSIPTV